jgi:hypothetical protein
MWCALDQVMDGNDVVCSTAGYGDGNDDLVCSRSGY